MNSFSKPSCVSYLDAFGYGLPYGVILVFGLITDFVLYLVFLGIGGLRLNLDDGAHAFVAA